MSVSFETLAQSLSSLQNKTTAIFFNPGQLELLTRKGVLPYNYIVSWGKLAEPQLLQIESFHNGLTICSITEEDYQHVQMVWETFGCSMIKKYSELYSKMDVFILFDVLENFRELCSTKYGLNCVRYMSVPRFSFDATLQKSQEVELDLTVDHNVPPSGIRGVVAQSIKLYAVSNNKDVPATFNASMPSNYLQYVDVNNVY
ncbi:hypothetical protein PR048_010019 [Dryococelus australis]|uniref:Uncharacterized protein n=1 Tax=Dryococelus australis TaxID=614101 RepID=A0ABQ9I1H9_9NEOP|nr:hypothetical protein PR048_010019 [Dryococelus australis]